MEQEIKANKFKCIKNFTTSHNLDNLNKEILVGDEIYLDTLCGLKNSEFIRAKLDLRTNQPEDIKEYIKWMSEPHEVFDTLLYHENNQKLIDEHFERWID